MKNACQQNNGITYYGNDDSRDQRMHHTGEPAPDAVHQIEDDGPAVYDDDPIAVEPQLDEDELDGDSDESNVQGEIISAEPHKGSAE
ncbi:hypothetical protein AALB52_23685 [Lachnospiraceae bacterium 38-14]|uniref:hypothetical protein n=1 Tax=Roseburia sp. 1XD42-69 TaxID=2320088 RepID=UPI001FA9ED05|nr:hypothetical protein [Roseburia sp. 1XD42-69]